MRMRMRMRVFLLFICFFFWLICLNGCSDKKSVISEGKYPVIDISNSIGNYKKVYASDYFSSIELIPLEIKNNCSINMIEGSTVLVNDSLIFIISELSTNHIPLLRDIFVFNRSGKFLNKIGGIGQGPGEFIGVHKVFLNHEKPTIFVDTYYDIYEYEYDGKFINSFHRPNELSVLDVFTYLEKNIFIGAMKYSASNRCKYILFDGVGDIIECFPGRCFINSDIQGYSYWLSAIEPFRIDKQLYLKDCLNDTLYTFENSNFQPAYVFDFGKDAYPLGEINEDGQKEIKYIVDANMRYIGIKNIIGTQKYFFYSVLIPPILPKPNYIKEHNRIVHGVYDVNKNTNVLLDTDRYKKRGIINDLDGGLPIFPQYYAGNNEIVDVWQADDMLEILTDEYFTSKTIKDKQANQKLKDLLKNLQEDDNPIIVIAKIK